MEARPPPARSRLGPALYAAWSASSALILAAGAHREAYRVLRGLSLPSLAVAAATGLANLSWFELAYVVGTALRRVAVFDVLPLVGVAASLAGAAAAFAPPPWNRRVPLAHLAIGLAVAGLALLVLARRHLIGFPDPWRLVATVAFLAVYAAWAAWFALGPRRGPPGGPGTGR